MSLPLRIRRTLILLAAAIICSVSGAQAAVPGVSPHRILFGQSAAFTGPARALGEEMRLGIEAAFRASNVRGGVFGRRLELTSLDDAYEPEAAILNTRRLIEQSKVFALIGGRRHAHLALGHSGRRKSGRPPISRPSPAPPSCAIPNGKTSSTCAPPTSRRPRRW